MNKLNIFVDETGMLEENTSELFGVSFVFHEQSNNISGEVRKLNRTLSNYNFKGMVHSAVLIANRDEYKFYSVDDRTKIFNALYQFARKVNIKCFSIFVDKKYKKLDMSSARIELLTKINDFLMDNSEYFDKFDSIVLYYDKGQEELDTLLNDIFSRYNGFKQISKFNKAEKRLFQVADMLTVVDKLEYKLNHNLKFNNSENSFFTYKRINELIKGLKSKRF